jgi:hypothetical protein
MSNVERISVDTATMNEQKEVSKNLSILHPAYDPPPGCEAAYRAGWNEAEKDRRREWSGDA